MLFRLKMLAWLLAVLVVVYGDSNAVCRDSSLECMSHTQLHSMVKELRTKYETVQSHLSESNCTICNVLENVCLNGGICLPEGGENYRCDCPYNYTGDHCETPVVCSHDACGPDAECRVFNHRVNCNCKLGYTGDPYSQEGCNKTIVTSCMSGDPHYYSFDRNFFDYQGTCPYVVSKNCKSIAPYADFVIKARNALDGPQSHSTNVVEVELETHGINIHIDRQTNLYVNGVLRNYNFYYPNSENPEVSVENNFGQIVINTVDGLQILFRLGYLCVSIPDVPELQGANTLCGLLGNRDKNCKNDLTMSNGTIVTDDESSTPCNHGFDWMGSEIFGDSWIINKTDFLNTVGDYFCEPGHIIANVTLNCTLQDARDSCESIKDAETETGFFKVCAPLGQTILEHLFDDCIYDVCLNPDERCPVLDAFVEQCQSEIPFADVGDWRSALNCPPYYCPVDSTYSSCASRCQPTCAYANGTVSNGCIDTCTEGCVCNTGYVVDTTSVNFKCIPIEECGCTDDDGNTYSAGATWLDDNCSKKYTCKNGSIVEIPNQCSAQGQCTIDGGIMECRCLPGFMGNGYDCQDINECEQPSVCNQMYGWGNCTNTPGSYYCNCSDFFVGSNCQTYQPKRHCADLYVYNNVKTSGPYLIYPSGTPSESVLVYCDMEKDGGGWTLIGNSAGQVNSNKTFGDYELGFGNPNQKNGWIGLSWLHLLANSTITMSLRVELERCINTVSTFTYCTYPDFELYGPETQYTVYIPEVCTGGNETNGIVDGWIRWDPTQPGPKFYAFDNDVDGCSESFLSTGWWYNPKKRCGPANLNGVSFTCDNIPDLDDISEYMEFSGTPVASSQMYLRPKEFPDYDQVSYGSH